MPAILDRHLGNNGSNRQFVRDFIQAVYHATGETFSPPVYRRILKNFAPERAPSNDVFASEKAAFVKGISLEGLLSKKQRESKPRVDRSPEGASVVPPHSLQSVAAERNPAYLLAQRDFLQGRLSECEVALVASRRESDSRGADLKASNEIRSSLLGQLEAARQAELQLVARLEKMTAEMAGMRNFAMAAIEAARGETRAQQERANHLESLLKAEKYNTEVFRRLAYRNGAPIPVQLLPEPKT